MKIIAVGRNYAAHIEELKNEKPTEPVIFTKPDTAVLRNNDPFYHPDFSEDIHHEVEIVIRIGREGKYIEEEFAHKYIDSVGIGIDFTARDIQSRLKEKSLPWDLAKGFNGSAPISEFIPLADIADLQNIDFGLKVNGEWRQQGNTSLMIYPIAYLLSFVSKYFTLKTGDLIFTGTPKGVAAVKPGDRLEAYIGEQKMMDFEVK